jgi:hypothetical protein
MASCVVAAAQFAFTISSGGGDSCFWSFPAAIICAMASQKRIALTGFGFMGSMHAQVYGQLPDVQLIAVADANPAAARAKLERLKIVVPVYPTLGELLVGHP